MLQTDYGIVNMVNEFAYITEHILKLSYDYKTLHDIKNLVCYIMFRKFTPRMN